MVDHNIGTIYVSCQIIWSFYLPYKRGVKLVINLLVLSLHFRNLTCIYELAARMFGYIRYKEIDEPLIAHYNHPKIIDQVYSQAALI